MFKKFLDWITGRTQTRRMLSSFMLLFQDKCPVCAYHRYGIREGFVRCGTPVSEHWCREQINEETEQPVKLSAKWEKANPDGSCCMACGDVIHYRSFCLVIYADEAVASVTEFRVCNSCHDILFNDEQDDDHESDI